MARAGAVLGKAPDTRSPYASREVGESSMGMEPKGKGKRTAHRELLRIYLLDTQVNKGKERKGRSC